TYAAKRNELKGLKEKNLAFEEEKIVLSAANETELASLTAQVAKLTGFQLSCDELSVKEDSLESERYKLVD
ncbi:hypothetical protein Tco_0621216, partial [Tanacetum coccineum]